MSFLKKKQKKEIPEDLGIVIVSKDVDFWQKAKRNVEAELEGLERGVKFNKAVLEMINQKLTLAEKNDK